ncbi:MAG TPA: response regulator transcription factor [Methylomirabilota bacterium]|nr:response regulator transcription factor [Methylomirabilota bacterium]
MTTATAKLSVLAVEDEPDVADLVRYHLEKAGYEVRLASNGAEALRLAREARPGLILLDLMVPEVNGWEVCRRLKGAPETRSIPVIMLTSRAEEGDKILGFELGAEDYVTKPFSPLELLARIRAVSRRSAGTGSGSEAPRMQVGSLEIDCERFEVTMQSRRVVLTPKEFGLLTALARHPGRVFPRDALLDLVWGQDGFVEPRTVDVHVARLRAKFFSAGLPDPGIETVRGVGYRLGEPA